MFETLIVQFRTDWRQIELPFLFVQLPRYGISGTRYNWCVIREAQDNIWRRVPHTGMVVSIDTGERDYVHPSEKRVVSGRLAELCKAMVYGLPAAWRYPRYCGCRTEGKAMVLSVEHAPLCPAPHAAGVEICGQDGVFYPADARVTENSIIASAPQVPYPVAARYAWDNYPQTSIYSQEGLPLAPFRTDSLPIETVHAASTEVPRVPVDEIRDTMENWEHVWQREGVWSFHVDTTGAYGKSERRVRKWTEAEQWLLYRIANPVKSISVRYLTRRSYDGEIQLYVSADGERWSNAVTQIVGGRPVADGWNCYTVSAAQIPKGAYYVKVAVAATPAGEDCHDPMIEQIEIV